MIASFPYETVVEGVIVPFTTLVVIVYVASAKIAVYSAASFDFGTKDSFSETFSPSASCHSTNRYPSFAAATEPPGLLEVLILS